MNETEIPAIVHRIGNRAQPIPNNQRQTLREFARVYVYRIDFVALK